MAVVLTMSLRKHPELTLPRVKCTRRLGNTHKAFVLNSNSEYFAFLESLYDVLGSVLLGGTMVLWKVT